MKYARVAGAILASGALALAFLDLARGQQIHRNGFESRETAWRKGTDQEARLGVRDNSADLAFLADGWPTPDRPAVQTEEIVPPGATATFTFAVKSELPGTYVLPLRGVVDGGAWMDDMGLYAKVTVRKGMSGRKGALE